MHIRRRVKIDRRLAGVTTNSGAQPTVFKKSNICVKSKTHMCHFRMHRFPAPNLPTEGQKNPPIIGGLNLEEKLLKNTINIRRFYFSGGSILLKLAL
jgi:hypothetical protein